MATCGRNGLFLLINYSSSLRKVKAETNAKNEVGNHGNYFLIGLLTMALSTCFLNTNQDHLPRRGITHSGMGTPTSTRNQQNVLETLPIAILLEAVPQLCFFPFWGDSFCVKLIKTNKQNYLHFLSSWETQSRVCGGSFWFPDRTTISSAGS